MVNYKPLLLIHGALGSDKTLYKLANLITNRPCFVVNLSGHGDHPFIGPLSFEIFTDDILNCMLQNNIQNCDVFGYSMGGYAALNMALTHPNKIDQITTLGTKMQWSPEIAAKETAMLNPEIMLEKVPQYVQYLQSLHGENWHNLVLQTAQLMKDLGNGKSLTESDLQKIPNKVTMCLGTLDKMVSVDETKWAVSHLPNAIFKPLDGVVHPIEKVDLGVFVSESHDMLSR